MQQLPRKGWQETVSIALLFIVIITGIIFFSSQLSTSVLEFERYIIYSVIIVFGITMGVETYFFQRLKEEDSRLKNEIGMIRKEMKQIKK